MRSRIWVAYQSPGYFKGPKTRIERCLFWDLDNLTWPDHFQPSSASLKGKRLPLPIFLCSSKNSTRSESTNSFRVSDVNSTSTRSFLRRDRERADGPGVEVSE